MQLLKKSRGLKDTHSIEIAGRVLNIAVKLANDFDLHEVARRITRSLYDVTNEVPEVVEWLEQDFAALDRIINANGRGRGDREDQGELDFGAEEHVGSGVPTGSVPPPPGSGRRVGQPSETKETELDGFVQLCQSIGRRCRERIDTNDSQGDSNIEVFNAAHRNYQRDVLPWLAIICEACRDDTQTVARAQNAAAVCLASLADGFIYVRELELAERLLLEALPLVVDGKELEQTKGQTRPHCGREAEDAAAGANAGP